MSVAYREYINSPEWEARKLAYFTKHPKKCAGCGSRERVELHHHTYERMGHERDADMVPVCKTCHGLIHRHHDTKPKRVRDVEGSLTESTFEVLGLLSGTAVVRKRRRKKGARRKSATVEPKATVDQGKPEFVPRNLRGAKVLEGGVIRSSVKWRDECRNLKFR